MELPHDFGDRVRAARAYKDDMTRADLARALKVSPGYIKGLEGGKRPDALKAQALVTRLPEITDLPEDFFLGRASNGVAAELAAIRIELETLRVESARNALEVIQRLDEGLGPSEAAQ